MEKTIKIAGFFQDIFPVLCFSFSMQKCRIAVDKNVGL